MDKSKTIGQNKKIQAGKVGFFVTLTEKLRALGATVEPSEETLGSPRLGTVNGVLFDTYDLTISEIRTSMWGRIPTWLGEFQITLRMGRGERDVKNKTWRTSKGGTLAPEKFEEIAQKILAVAKDTLAKREIRKTNDAARLATGDDPRFQTLKAKAEMNGFPRPLVQPDGKIQWDLRNLTIEQTRAILDALVS